MFAKIISMLGNFACFFVCLLIFFFKISIFLKFFKKKTAVLNILDPDQSRNFFVWTDLGPNCLQRLSAGDTGRKELI